MGNAIEKIHEFQRFGSVLGLERMNVILDKLGNPQDGLKVIHVAGTNGKGSICKYIYEVLQAGGYKTGLYTSPFLEIFNERIEFNGEYISNEDLDKYTKIVLEKSKEMIDEGLDSPTEFEIITAIAFLYFKEMQADYVVLEVGLGGRGDSTNVVNNPLVSIIASISLDHTDRLGNTISLIAAEKAGIMKKNCPVVIGTNLEEARLVFKEKAEQLECDLYDSTQLDYNITEKSLEGCKYETRIFEEDYSIEISMLGEHQVRNSLEALEAIAIMKKQGKLNISKAAIYKGFKKAKQIGRFEIMQEKPLIIIDGAHNPDGSKALREAMKLYLNDKKILLVVGILADKEVSEVSDNFLDITKDFVLTEPNNPRKMVADELEKIISAKGGNCIIMRAPKDAVNYIKTKCDEYDVIVFAGSLYLIGEIRGLLRHE